VSLPPEEGRDHLQLMHDHLRRHIRELAGLEDTSGIELFGLMRMLMNLCEAIETQHLSESDLSGPRWGLLLRLFAEEQHGRADGVSPSALSRFQRVSRNTISALLRGLEEQGLVQRALDADDRRRFRIQLTAAGRELLQSTAPQRIHYLNHMVSGLSKLERQQLIGLLTKLYRSLVAASHAAHTEPQGG
jgi:DNA-binding MarR family transcriptional regulator